MNGDNLIEKREGYSAAPYWQVIQDKFRDFVKSCDGVIEPGALDVFIDGEFPMLYPNR
jgi:hypothetical protein